MNNDDNAPFYFEAIEDNWQRIYGKPLGELE
jgi:hypothetical protein